MAALRPHVFTVGAKKYFIRLPDVYDNGADYTVGSAFGISKLTGDIEVSDDDDRMEVSDGLKNGKLIRVRISYKKTVNGVTRTKTARLVCPINKAAAGIAAVQAKKYAGVDVTTSGIPRRRRLG